MKTYMITYDLHKPGQNYEPLYGAIKLAANGWWHSMNNIWLINTAANASSIRDFLKSHIDANDVLFVIEVDADWASWNLSKSATDWLYSHKAYLAA